MFKPINFKKCLINSKSFFYHFFPQDSCTALINLLLHHLSFKNEGKKTDSCILNITNSLTIFLKYTFGKNQNLCQFQNKGSFVYFFSKKDLFLNKPANDHAETNKPKILKISPQNKIFCLWLSDNVFFGFISLF
ncbi:MAG: hypothetical protein CM15mV96_090 [uncultured marine virus]|nr:MAG: hypothetical protein CM15mV96_090 [uncultured marine virus]